MNVNTIYNEIINNPISIQYIMNIVNEDRNKNH